MYNKQYFDRIEKSEKVQALSLAEVLMEMYNPKSVADVGCATGLYLWPFHDIGIKTMGFELADDAVKNAVVPTVVKVDMTAEKFHTSKKDLVLCLEVLEHIDNELCDRVIDKIAKMTNLVIFSAAQPGQKGTGHINCQTKEYWEQAFKMRGYEKDIEAEKQILDFVTKQDHAEWFKNNLQVFRKV